MHRLSTLYNINPDLSKDVMLDAKLLLDKDPKIDKEQALLIEKYLKEKKKYA